jgi:thymidylate synthase (FAD)
VEEQHKRVSVPAIDAIIGRRFDVLDAGFVRVVDYMGSDAAIVQAARVSYGKGTKRIHEDRGLIRYLMRHRHTTPFEMCEIKLHVRVPMDCWRQWIRHRTANVNEYSTRYSEAIDVAQRTDPREWREQADANRQGSGAYLDSETGRNLTQREREVQSVARQVYENRLERGVAREQARKDLPLSTYTEAYWKIDLHNLLHFLSLRMDSHAQVEIRQYATVIGTEIVQKWCPLTWKAFEDYRLNAMLLTQLEADVISHIARGEVQAAMAVARDAGWLEKVKGQQTRNREREECGQKLVRLGMAVPWEAKESD